MQANMYRVAGHKAIGVWTLALSLLLSPLASPAQTEIVKIPAGTQMGANPVAAQAKLQEKKAVFGGVERTWYEYVPASYKGDKAVPLVVAVHGGSADGVWMFGATSWGQIADQLGFIVIYPNGSIPSGKGLRWNAYEKFNTDPGMAISANNGVDEALFFKELIEKVEKDYKIDTSRIYMHGQSNGGVMTSYFGLRYPAMLAAMAPNSAPPAIEVLSAYPITTPLPTYFWGGEVDTVAGQYNPLNKSRTVICKEFAEFWARVNKADPEPKLRLDGNYNTKIYSGDAEVRNTEFRNGVHSLPFTASYVIWNEFFTRFARGKNGAVVRLVPDAEQVAPPDSGAIAVKLGASFGLVNNNVVRLGKTPDAAAAMAYGAPSNGVIVPADFITSAFGGSVAYQGDEARITTKAGTANFTIGTNKFLVNGKEAAMPDVTTVRVASGANADVMVSLLGLSRALGKTVSTRKDFYRNDIYYVSDRPADLSAQTITYIEQKLTGKNQ